MHFVGKAEGNNLVGTIDFAGAGRTQVTATRVK
jgi:hypothetical protein